MKLSKEQKTFILEQLNSQFKSVQMLCDGYEITLRMERYKMKLVIGIYVNGSVKGVWVTKPEKHQESKFLASHQKSYYSAKEKAERIKVFGKREANKRYDLDKKFEYKLPYFSTAQAALTHLIKVSDSIELIGEMAA
ncbi:MAG: hypothetical protein ACK410_02630 [Acinetobacter sp.]